MSSGEKRDAQTAVYLTGERMAVSQVGGAGHAVPALCAVPIHVLPEGLESGCCCGGGEGHMVRALLLYVKRLRWLSSCFISGLAFHTRTQQLTFDPVAGECCSKSEQQLIHKQDRSP